MYLFVGAIVLVAFFDFGLFFIRRAVLARVLAPVISELRQDAFTAAIEVT